MTSPEVTLSGLIGKKQVVRGLKGATQDRIIAELLECMSKTEDFAGEAVESMARAIIAREREATTGIGHGVAIPHLKECSHVSELRGVFGRSAGGVDWLATDGEAVHLFFMILTPPGQDREHVRIMKRIVRLSRDGKTLRYLRETESLKNLRAIFQEVDDQID